MYVASVGHQLLYFDLSQAEARFAAMGDVFVKLASTDKRERITAAAQRWPSMSGAAIALLCDSSAAYVSEVLNNKVVDA